MVYRYLAHDGLEGEEGTFLLCTFWLAQAQALIDNYPQAFSHIGLVNAAWAIVQVEQAAGDTVRASDATDVEQRASRR